MPGHGVVAISVLRMYLFVYVEILRKRTSDDY